MTYLGIDSRILDNMYAFWWQDRRIMSWEEDKNFEYLASFEIRELVRRYRQDYWSESDPLTSGVLADWLEDHRQELLEGATGPSDPAVRLNALIQYLRDRFNALPVA